MCASQGLTKKALFCCQAHSLLQLGAFVGAAGDGGVSDRRGSEVSGCLPAPREMAQWEKTLVTKPSDLGSKRSCSPVPLGPLSGGGGGGTEQRAGPWAG